VFELIFGLFNKSICFYIVSKVSKIILFTNIYMFKNFSSVSRDPLGSMARGLGKMTGTYLTENQYNQLTALTNQLAIDYSVEKVIQKYGTNTEELVKELLIQRNIINYALNEVYSRRLKYLENKILSDPRNSDTKSKKDVIEDTMRKLGTILNSINRKLQELDPDNVITNKVMAEARTKTGSYTSSYSPTDDPSFWLLMQNIDFKALIEGLGHILSAVGNVFGSIIVGMMSGGMKKIKTHKQRKTKKNKKTRRRRHLSIKK